MDVRVLDASFNHVDVIDDFRSIIWTDRYTTAGDFKMTIDAKSPNVGLLQKGVRLSAGTHGMKASNTLYADLDECEFTQEVMVVDTVEEKNTTSDPGVLTVSGYSLLGQLNERVAGANLLTGVAFDNAGYTGPMRVIETLVNDACGPGCYDYDNNHFPDIQVSQHISEALVDLSIKRGNLYERIVEIANAYSYGLDMVYYRRPEYAPGVSSIWFSVYKGTDRTSEQTAHTPVILGPGLDSLTETTELRSQGNFKNAAFVYGKDKFVTVELNEASPATGWDRRVLMVEATDLTGTTTTVTNKLKNRGLIELKKYQEVMAYDGELSVDCPFKYGVDFFMGDVVELRSPSGLKQKVRVTEYIRAQDANGYREYPTLTAIE